MSKQAKLPIDLTPPPRPEPRSFCEFDTCCEFGEVVDMHYYNGTSKVVLCEAHRKVLRVAQ